MIYLCRHGETEWTITGRHTGVTDIPLTEKGKEQAVAMQKKLAKIEFEKVYSSPKKRALDTALGYKPLIEPLLQEWNYGEYEGKTTQEIHQNRGDWNLFLHGAPGGESVDEVGKRADQFLAKLKGHTGNIAIFSHGHFLRVLAARYVGLQAEWGKALALQVASISILCKERKENVILLWNERVM